MRIYQGVYANIKDGFIFESDEILKGRNIIPFYCCY